MYCFFFKKPIRDELDGERNHNESHKRDRYRAQDTSQFIVSCTPLTPPLTYDKKAEH